MKKTIILALLLTFFACCFNACGRSGRGNDDGASNGYDSEEINGEEVNGEGTNNKNTDSEETKKEGEDSNPTEKATSISESTGENNEEDSGSFKIANKDKWLLGTWLYSDSSGSVSLSIIIEFKKDGAFIEAVGSGTGYLFTATSFVGKYKIVDNKIVLYDQLKSTSDACSTDELWKMALTQVRDIPVDDKENEFEKADDNTLMYGGTEFKRMQ